MTELLDRPSKVRAYRPQSYSDPVFVAYTYEDLQAKEGEYIGGPQCEGCGNWTYEIQCNLIAPGTKQYMCVCTRDPASLSEHDDPCGAVYNIGIYDANIVVF